MYGIYQVFNGDTLETIANEVGTSVQKLKELNGITTDVMLRPGSFIIVPKYDSTYEKYTIKSGDNMYAISKKHGVDYKSLLKLNGLEENDYIYPNETILIPRQQNAYVTEQETLQEIATKLGKSISEIISKNPNLEVVEDQIVRY